MKNIHIREAEKDLLTRLPRWIDPASIPLTYGMDGVVRKGLDESFTTRILSDETADNARRIMLEGVDKAGLAIRLEYTEYRDYPVVEWLAFFENRGAAPSAKIENVRIGVCELPGTSPVLWHSNGDTRRADGYTWESLALDAPVTLDPEGGTSCCGAFPYMRLCMPDFCVNLAIGWPGHWCAEFTPTENGTKIAFGQKRFSMRILPGETIRTPRITMMITAGGEDRSRNMWRRWFIDHILVRENGKPLPPKLCMHLYQENGKPEHTGATEAGQLSAMAEYHRRGLHPDIWWIDAGWYPCNYDWPRIGTWKPDKNRFPRGLKPIGDECHRYGMQFLLWFEPERARPNTELFGEHPEWMLHKDDSRPENEHCLVDIGNFACCDWLIERIDSIIKEAGVGIYRQDFNYFSAPEELWIRKEGGERAGAVENLHVQGYLRLWDTLRERNPGLWVDSCASGGRRNDLETMRRGVPLHYTDVGYGNHPIKQKQHRLMFEWIPYFRAHNMAWDRPDGTYGNTMEQGIWYDEFSFQAAMAPALTSMVHIHGEEREFDMARKMHPIWRRAADMMLRSDYYPLTECRASAQDYYAMQFDDPSSGDGFVQILRNTRAEEVSFTAHLRGLLSEAVYRFTDAVSGEAFTVSGGEAAAGITVRIPKRSAVLYFYRKIE